MASRVKAEPKLEPKAEVKEETVDEVEEVEFYQKRGQRHPIPPPAASDRVFYESLYRENPGSELALVWLIEVMV